MTSSSHPLQEKAQGRNAHYKLTSTVMLWLQTIKADSGTMNLGGSLTRQAECDQAISDSSPHIVKIGRMVEMRAGRKKGGDEGLNFIIYLFYFSPSFQYFHLLIFCFCFPCLFLLQDMENKTRFILGRQKML